MDFQDELKIYAITAAHFIIASVPEWLGRINSVILFGSVAQGMGDKDSDIDLFFDTNISEKQRIKLRSEIRKAISQFRMSQEGLKFKMKGIVNEISFFVGHLKEWEDLQRSIAVTGIILYGKYRGEVSKKSLKHFLLISWETKSKRRGAFLNKIYGYKIKGRKYKGLIEKYKGLKIGKSAALIPLEYKDEFLKTIEDYGLGYNIIEVFRW